MMWAVGGAILLFIYVALVFAVWHCEHTKKVSDACETCYREYDLGIMNRDRDLMHTALFNMTHICPHATGECMLKKCCHKCEKPYGFKKALEEKYGKVIDP